MGDSERRLIAKAVGVVMLMVLILAIAEVIWGVLY